MTGKHTTNTDLSLLFNSEVFGPAVADKGLCEQHKAGIGLTQQSGMNRSNIK